VFCDASHPFCLKFRGSHENTELAGIMSNFLGDVDIAKITSKLIASGFNVTAPVVA
jgi:hypothetical protein